MARRVVVTGLGAITPLGNTVADTWQGIVEGRSGVAEITEFDVSAYNTRFAARVDDFDPTAYMPGKDARKFESFIQYGIAALEQSISDAGLRDAENVDPVNEERE